MIKKSFAKLKDSVLPLPNLVKMHTDSYQWLITEGLEELFKEFSPISDYSQKKFTLEFVGFSLEETRKRVGDFAAWKVDGICTDYALLLKQILG